MARYNQKTQIETVPTHQGGVGIQLQPKLELIAILANGLESSYYETLGEREQRLVSLIKQISQTDIEFVAKALVYTRSVLGQRSVTHFGSVHLASLISGNTLGSRFFSKRNRKQNKGGIIYRLDDMLEIAAAYFSTYPGKPLSNSIKKGFKLALENADAYELAKYQGKGRMVSLVDIVNLTHPKPSPEMKDAFEALMKGNLKQFNTVEDKNTESGKNVASKLKAGEISEEEASKELQESKETNYKELIQTRKIGYLALIRNLRNIVINVNDPEVINEACDLITDSKLIKQSLIFPHQIDIALEVLLLENLPQSKINDFVVALNKAYELAIPNLTNLFPYGSTAVVIDTSGSMFSGWGQGCKMGQLKINKQPVEKASLIGATLAKGLNADLFQFASDCKPIRYNSLDTINTIKNKVLGEEGVVGHGTSFSSIFDTLGRYDRIFIISDLQGRDQILRNSSYQRYKTNHGSPMIYTVDLVGYGTTMFNHSEKVAQLFGYSSEIYELVKKAEIDPKVILKEIEAIKI